MRCSALEISFGCRSLVSILLLILQCMSDFLIFLKPYLNLFPVCFMFFFVCFSCTISNCFVLFITIAKENRQDISVITGFCWKKNTLCTWHSCCKLPAQIINMSEGTLNGEQSIQQWIQSLSNLRRFVLYFVFSHRFDLIRMYFVCFSYLHMVFSYSISYILYACFLSYIFRICFELFRIGVNFCLFRVVSFRLFVIFFVFVNLISFFLQVISYSISYVYARGTKENYSHGLHCVFCISYCFRIVSHLNETILFRIRPLYSIFRSHCHVAATDSADRRLLQVTMLSHRLPILGTPTKCIRRPSPRDGPHPGALDGSHQPKHNRPPLIPYRAYWGTGDGVGRDCGRSQGGGTSGRAEPESG
jgi:hypothetical protein